MFHRLQFGYLDTQPSGSVFAPVLRPLPMKEVLAVLDRYSTRGEDGIRRIGDEPIDFGAGYIDLPWIGARKYNVDSVHLALELCKAFPGTVLVNLGGGGVVTPEELLLAPKAIEAYLKSRGPE